MNFSSKYDKDDIIFEFRWKEDTGWEHFEVLDIPKDTSYEEFEECIDGWFGQGAPYKDFEYIIENLCLQDPDYSERMTRELSGYDARGHVTWEYDDMVDCKFWEVIRPMLGVAYNMGVGEAISCPYFTLVITRVQ